ncbi:putative 6-phosphogluconolactonase 1 [Asimina triloba]
MADSGGPDDRVKVRVHESLDELATELVAYVADLSEMSVKERGFFAIALSGGSLISLLGKLCEAPYNKTADWAKWHIFWVDERVVAKNHADSNYKQAKDSLLSKVGYMLFKLDLEYPAKEDVPIRSMMGKNGDFNKILVIDEMLTMQAWWNKGASSY